MLRLLLLLFSVVFLSVKSVVHAQTCNTTTPSKILILGDSWSALMHRDKIISNQLSRMGYGDWKEKGDKTAIAGSTASMWANPEVFPIIKNELLDNPSIEVVVLIIGGNDMLAGRLREGWYVDITPQNETILLNKIENDIRTIINGIKQANPNITVVICGYDYINLVHSIFDPGTWVLWDNLGQPTPRQVNDAFIKLEQRKINIANQDPQVHYVHNFGLMQRKYGYEGFFGPNVTPIPGNTPPNYSPYPGGNPDFPSSKKALDGDGSDPIHLNKAGYAEVTRNLINHFFLPFFNQRANATFTSEGQNMDGFTKSNSISNAQFRLGRDGGGFFRNIISFNTSSLPDNAEIESASIFITRSEASLCALPKPMDKTKLFLDVKSGFFGITPNLEQLDYNTFADAYNVGCFVGNTNSNGSKLRIDVDPSGLEFINKSGITQFRFYMDDNSITGSTHHAFFDGDASANNKPVLEIKYSANGNREEKKAEVPIEKIIEERELWVYPNPAVAGGVLYLNYKENADLIITDAMGKVILSRRINQGQNEVQLPSEMLFGMYYINTIGKSGKTTKSIMISK